MNKRLRASLRKRGAGHEEIERAEREGRLALLAFDRQLIPGRARYDFTDVAELAKVEERSARRLWRALGFPDPPPGERRFTDEDLDALSALRDWFRSESFPGEHSFEGLLQQVRVVGAALARVAEVQSDTIGRALETARAQGLSDEEIAEVVPDAVDWPRLAGLLDYVMRLQLRAALWRKLAGERPGEPGAASLAVGFVDLVGYTALSQELDPDDLANLVDRFEELAFDTVAEHGGRVVKMIGDEVMYVTEDTAAAARIALRLTARSAVDELLPEARAGLACGSVVVQEGDYYGPVVNLASRLVELGRPGSVLVSDDVQRVLAGHETVGFQRLRSRRIRDIGRVEIYLLRGIEQEEVAEA